MPFTQNDDLPNTANCTKINYAPKGKLNSLADASSNSISNRDLENRAVNFTQSQNYYEKNANTVCMLMNDTDNDFVCSNKYTMNDQDLCNLPKDNDLDIAHTENFITERIEPRHYA